MADELGFGMCYMLRNGCLSPTSFGMRSGTDLSIPGGIVFRSHKRVVAVLGAQVGFPFHTHDTQEH